ncbi:Alpha/beta hydrolase family protein [Enhygromyxa salina]|uniref:Alpha/beta hydrolase family protein n=1 Tax=Enhygromyxa salina TaxID=215803 RepID=A0A2S9XBJ4_9BACT|nr:alpha/beta hydrolase [Enhygromyxa salina]PRP90170.1 Alpha/beta hydrolase family protein [Enhygromyxa salina]
MTTEDHDRSNAPQKSLLRSVLRWTLLATVGLLVGLVGLLLARPESLLFYPSPHLANTPDDIGWDYESVEITTEDGETLSAWYLPAAPGGALEQLPWVVLYCHGNGGNIGGRMGVLTGLRALGLSVLIFDYRGYGHSSGRPTVAGTRLDVLAAWRYLVDERGYEPSEIVMWGRSLGGAVAIDQAARVTEAGMPPAALVVESSFTSTLDIGRELYPWLPVGWFGRKLDYPSRERIGEVTAPVLLAHSPDDDLIPAEHGQALREAAAAGSALRVEFVELGGGHNDGHLSELDHLDAVAGFLQPGT